MKVIIDTNIFIDVMLDRKPLAESSACVLKACENGAVQGFVSASCVTDIFYIIRKYSHSAEKAYSAIGNILEIAGIIPVTESEILRAYKKHYSDFEDGLLSECAFSAGADYIVTRNTKDFSESVIPAITPEDFLKIIT